MDVAPGGTTWDARSLPQRRNFIQAGDPADVTPHFAAIPVDGTTPPVRRGAYSARD
jgi:hypothetical protein